MFPGGAAGERALVSCKPYNPFGLKGKAISQERPFLRKVHRWGPGRSNIKKQPPLLSLVPSVYVVSLFPDATPPQDVQSSCSSHCLSKAASKLQTHLVLFPTKLPFAQCSAL